jgi:hypothetical protein
MSDYDFKELKEDTVSLVKQTVDAGNSIEGGFSRAIDEYWLNPENLGGPSNSKNYLIRLLFLASICSYRKQLNLGSREELDESAVLLAELISKKDLASISETDRNEVNSLILELLPTGYQVVFNAKM